MYVTVFLVRNKFKLPELWLFHYNSYRDEVSTGSTLEKSTILVGLRETDTYPFCRRDSGNLAFTGNFVRIALILLYPVINKVNYAKYIRISFAAGALIFPEDKNFNFPKTMKHNIFK